MAIMAPADLPAVMKVHTNEMKKYVLSRMGYGVTEVEISEDQFETIWRVVGDFIAGYFPREQRLATFWTTPLKSTYPLPVDAYWVQEVAWDPVTTRIDDVFGAESFLFNIGNISGSQNMLLDYHLLQAYRKFSQKVLGTEGHWEVINEVNGEAKDQLIRLYPTPKGAFPVVVLYIPVVTHFRSPKARLIAYEAMLAQAKMCVGASRRKLTGMPTPDGGSISYDGGDLVTEGQAAWDKCVEDAIGQAEPLQVHIW